MEQIKSKASSVFNVLNNIKTSKKTILLWLVVLVFFIAAAVFVYINHIKPKLELTDFKANYEFDKEKSADTTMKQAEVVPKNATVYFFWACWCPNSNDADEPGKMLHDNWKQIEEEYKTQEWNVTPHKLSFVKVSENDNDFTEKEAKVKNDGEEIDGFPSIFIVYDEFHLNEKTKLKEKITIKNEMDTVPTKENIKKFIIDNLN